MSKRKLRDFGQFTHDRFVRLPHYLLASPAWKTSPSDAKALLIDVMTRYNGMNNGEISYSVREAEEMGISRARASRAFATLIDRGFLRVTRASVFTMKQHEARLWAITGEKVGEMPATKDFMRWRPSPSISQTPVKEFETRSHQRDAQSQQKRLPSHKRPRKRSTVPPAGPSEPQTHRLQSHQRDTSILPGQGGGNGAAAPAANAHAANGSTPFMAAIRAKALAEGLSITALAARCGLSRPQLSNALAGRTRLSPAAMTLLRIYESGTP